MVLDGGVEDDECGIRIAVDSSVLKRPRGNLRTEKGWKGRRGGIDFVGGSLGTKSSLGWGSRPC